MEVAQLSEHLELIAGHLVDPLLVLLGRAQEAELAGQLAFKRGDQSLEVIAGESAGAGAVDIDGGPDDGRRIVEIAAAEDEPAGQVGQLELARDGCVWKRQEVR